jgi:hypothetical protein
MTYSYELIQKLKSRLELKSDNETAKVLPKATSGIISEIKSGKRCLTEEQAIFIIEHCSLDCALTLVELAAESAKTTTAQTVWHNLAKKLKATTKAVVVALILVVSATSGHYPTQRIRSIP